VDDRAERRQEIVMRACREGVAGEDAPRTWER
jgi:hypothetical protein